MAHSHLSKPRDDSRIEKFDSAKSEVNVANRDIKQRKNRANNSILLKNAYFCAIAQKADGPGAPPGNQNAARGKENNVAIRAIVSKPKSKNRANNPMLIKKLKAGLGYPLFSSFQFL